MRINLRARIPKVPNIVAKACLYVVFYLWFADMLRSSVLYPGARCLHSLAQVLLCGVAMGAHSKQIVILAGVSGCVSLFFFVRDYSDVLYFLKLKRELDVYYQAGR